MADVLLVDDEKMARAMYSDFLVGAGHNVVAVGTLAEARKALTATRFDLVVTDLLLPEGDGMHVLQLTKTMSPATEVVVITALDKVDPAVRAIKSGASDYLVKPVSPEVLAHAVARALTTRTLVQENESLRRHVSLMETGQRIATTLDRERLHAVASASFAQVCNADAATFVLKEDANIRFAGTHELAEELIVDLQKRLKDPLLTALSDPHVGGAVLRCELPAPFQAAYFVPAMDGSRVPGGVLLLYKGAVSEDCAVAAPFLATHLTLALRNVGRFAEVEDLVYLDDLTHLFNRRYLELVLQREFRQGEGSPTFKFSLLFLDLDYFKSINDSHGHLVGSKVLVEMGRILKNCVRENDVVSRWGGDEFVVLLRDTDSGGSLKVAERIRRSVESHHFLAREGYSLSVTTCIGIASYPEHSKEQSALLDYADRAMYRGKKGARNIIYIAQRDLEPTPLARKHTVITEPR